MRGGDGSVAAGAPLAMVRSVPRIPGGMQVPFKTHEEVLRLNEMISGEDATELNANFVSDKIQCKTPLIRLVLDRYK